jgi:hypothetical protein
VEPGDHGLEHEADLRPYYPLREHITITFQPKRDAGFMPEPLTTPPTRSASRRRFTQRKAPFHPSIS